MVVVSSQVCFRYIRSYIDIESNDNFGFVSSGGVTLPYCGQLVKIGYRYYNYIVLVSAIVLYVFLSLVKSEVRVKCYYYLDLIRMMIFESE